MSVQTVVRHMLMSFSSLPQCQPSNIAYLSIIDMHADTREAMVTAVSKWEYGVGVTSEHLVVGDQKTYACLQEIKIAYGLFHLLETGTCCTIFTQF